MAARSRIASFFDRVLIGLAPGWGMRRVQARAQLLLAERHYEAAQGGRRTSGWRRTSSDANAAAAPALPAMRELSRDLLRNNGWAIRAVQTIVNNVVSWGIVANADDRSRARSNQALAIWNEWASSTNCDYDGRMPFIGIQKLAMRTIVTSGEVLIVRQPAMTSDGLAIPMRIQVLEPDYLDTSRSTNVVEGGGKILEGIEFDARGRRVAYWLFGSHPGSLIDFSGPSVRVSADRVIHVYQVDRPQQARGVPWLAAAILKLKDFDDFEDAQLIQQKVAACFAGFVTDLDGAAGALGSTTTGDDGYQIDEMQPGHIEYLPPGKSVTFAQPPSPQEGTFSARTLRSVAASLGISYEDLTGDYSNVNFSSARIARLANWANVHQWRWMMLIPLMLDGIWRWAMQSVAGEHGWPTLPSVSWAAPPMPVLEPDKEGLAFQRMLRNGMITWPEMIRQQGDDPVKILDEIERHNADVDERGIVLDCDPRLTNSSGQQQSGGPATPEPPADPAPATDSPVPEQPPS